MDGRHSGRRRPLSVVTAGIAEAPTQAVQLAKIAPAPKKVEELILAFTDAARLLADTVPTVAIAAERIRVAMEGLSGARLAVAGMEAVPAAREAGAGVRLTKDARAELAATERLAETKPFSIVRTAHLPDVTDPRRFDPQTLRGMSSPDIRARMPKSWKRRPAANGKGVVYDDPHNRGRQFASWRDIRLARDRTL